MKTVFIVFITFIGILHTSFKANGQAPVKTETMSANIKQEHKNKAASRIATLNLNDGAKEIKLPTATASVYLSH